eukprot:1341819-Prymnesium_polylepis.1
MAAPRGRGRHVRLQHGSRVCGDVGLRLAARSLAAARVRTGHPALPTPPPQSFGGVLGPAA